MTTNPPISAPDARRPAVGRRGFTLIELLVVMTIIGILVSMILVAQANAVRQAETRATQALILKLEGGLNDRLDALMQMKPLPNYPHAYLAGVYPNGVPQEDDYGPGMTPPALISKLGGISYPDPNCKTSSRAQAIALADYLKSEMPDVFFVQTTSPTATSYPLNFAALPYNPPNCHLTEEEDLGGNGGPLATDLGKYVLPIGHMVYGPRIGKGPGSPVNPPWFGGYGDSHHSPHPITGAPMFECSQPGLGKSGRGIFGASYSAAAGLYKNLGYLPTGYDLVDNNGNGLIDEWGEGVDSTNATAVTTRLMSHTHETARSEMLYALLVEGQGLLGSAFSADDFNDREVKDTDGDGLPEFVDAWGKPLQFFRWPVYYHSDTQRGQNIGPDLSTAAAPLAFLKPYASIYETREQNPLDPNQALMAPAWWLGTQNPAYPLGTASGSPTNASGGVAAYESLFHPLTEPMQYLGPTSAAGYVDQYYWDRGGLPGLGYRRAFFTKPLILSGGPDQRLGVLLYQTPTAKDLISVENNAVQFVPNEVMSNGGIPANLAVPLPNAAIPDEPTTPQTWYILDHGQDDITNHNVTAVAGSGG